MERYPRNISANHRLTEQRPPENLHRLVAAWGVATEAKRPTPKEVGRRNQDAFFAIPGKGIFGVLDGVGGAAAGTGGNAAHAMSDYLSEAFINFPADNEQSEQQIINNLQEIIKNADARYRQEFPQSLGGTTLTMVKLWEDPNDGKKKAIFLNIGDSSGYVKHRNEKVKQITEDDDILNIGIPNSPDASELKREIRQIINNAQKYSDLSQTRDIPWEFGVQVRHRFGNKLDWIIAQLVSEEDIFNTRSSISNSLCSQDPNFTIGVTIEEVFSGSTILLATDLIKNNLITKRINNKLRGRRHPKRKASMLVASAREKSFEAWSYDNIRPHEDDGTAEVIEIK